MMGIFQEVAVPPTFEGYEATPENIDELVEKIDLMSKTEYDTKGEKSMVAQISVPGGSGYYAIAYGDTVMHQLPDGPWFVVKADLMHRYRSVDA